MTTPAYTLDNQQNLHDIETLSRKLASPSGAALTQEEAIILARLRQQALPITTLRLLEQFFANNRIGG